MFDSANRRIFNRCEGRKNFASEMFGPPHLILMTNISCFAASAIRFIVQKLLNCVQLTLSTEVRSQYALIAELENRNLIADRHALARTQTKPCETYYIITSFKECRRARHGFAVTRRSQCSTKWLAPLSAAAHATSRLPRVVSNFIAKSVLAIPTQGFQDGKGKEETCFGRADCCEAYTQLLGLYWLVQTYGGVLQPHGGRPRCDEVNSESVCEGD